MMKAVFPYNHYIALSDQWRLYHNETSNILYKISLLDSKYFVLDGRNGVILGLLTNKDYTYAEYIREIGGLFSFPTESCTEAYLNSFFNMLNKDEEIILSSAQKIITETKYSAEDFIIPGKNFLYPRRLKTPIRLLIFPTGNCSTDCLYCYADLKNLRKQADMTLIQWRRIFKQAQALGIITIDISGGDLFARKDAAEFVCELIAGGFLFFLSTKCYVSGVQAQAIAEAGFNKTVLGVKREIQLSVDSYDDEVSKLLVGADAYFKRMYETAQNLIGAGMIPKIKSVVTSFNYRQIKKVILQFKEIGIKEFQITKYDDSLYRHKNEYSLTVEQEAAVKEDMKEVASAYPVLIIQGNLTYNLGISSFNDDFYNSKTEKTERNDFQELAEKTIYDVTGCSAGRTTLGITPDGRACLCEQMEMTPSFVFGDFKTQSIIDIWNQPELKDICFPARDKFKNTSCYDCDIFEECVIIKGQCFRDNYFGRNLLEQKGDLFLQTSNCFKNQNNSKHLRNI